MHQDLYIYIKIRAVQTRKMTAGSIIVFSNGDRKMAANEETMSSLLRRVYRAMTEEITPASNVEEELSRVLVHSSLLCAIHE